MPSNNAAPPSVTVISWLQCRDLTDLPWLDLSMMMRDNSTTMWSLLARLECSLNERSQPMAQCWHIVYAIDRMGPKLKAKHSATKA
ncbi:hypothetical protein THAOC_06452 [Thalassiosira oceanica]|uniref:Uncharacterized protein n=1 Tax=Thalassiosira oceanica TaxID=159749 RepID=K0T2T2_THAOC|nr:hypothetical protein THAOC_06452 [Thalassiosira oceanica]|eukprot:EJK72055.1 hypothetical protein THAOC_06452 [Thalassiosira oceanica]